jgi:hypothetical protein
MNARTAAIARRDHDEQDGLVNDGRRSKEADFLTQ